MTSANDFAENVPGAVPQPTAGIEAAMPVGATDPNAAAPNAEFVQLFTRHQRQLFLYILAQVARPQDAEEILQEANVVIWSKSRQFELGTHFLAWICRIANYEILKFRTKLRRQKLQFSDEFLQQVADAALQQTDDQEIRRKALSECLAKLRSQDRELIQARYSSGENGISLAEHLARPANSVYQSLSRIRRTLLECIQRRLAAEGIL